MADDQDGPWDGLHLHQDKHTEEEKDRVKAYTADQIDEYIFKSARTQRGA